jgi:hypothetical protein
MRNFFIFIKPVWDCILGSILFLVLISAGVLGAEPVYRVNSVYWTEPAVISETVPIRVDETAISYDFPYEPQIIERRILSTRIVSPATDLPTSHSESYSEMKIINKKPLSPLRQIEEQAGKKEKKILPEEKPDEKIFEQNNSDQTELSKSSEFSTYSATSTVASETITESPETVAEKPFPNITFPPLQEESERIVMLKPPQPSQSEPKQTSPVSSTIRGQSSGIDEVGKILMEPPPYPQGTVEVSAIDSKLLDNNSAGNGETLEKNDISTSATGNDSVVIAKDKEENKSKNENLSNGVNGVLLLATIISIAMLIYTVVIAFDYHQRWMQSLTAQNRCFSGLSDDETDMDVDLSDNIPRYNGNANIPSLSRFQSESSYY